jgi:hypothetical protein
MTKHKRTKRRSQKGGNWINPMSWFGNSGANEPSFLEKTKKMASSITQNVEGGLESAKSSVSSFGSSIGTTVSSFNPLSSPSEDKYKNDIMKPSLPVSTIDVPSSAYVNSTGGKRRNTRRSVRTMKGGLGLSYYATPVSGLKVAEPTSWQFYANGTNQSSIKGGSKKHRNKKSFRTRRHKRY